MVDHDPAWAARFLEIRDVVWPAVEDFAISMEHVGSTSVPGLAAKPVIDLDIIVPQGRVADAVVALSGIGYEHRGDLGVTGREAFRRPAGTFEHHLYVCPEASLQLRNHLAVRDFLRTHPHAAAEYGALKRRLASRFSHDIDRYVDGKTDFLVDVLRRSGFDEADLERIRAVNEA